MDGEYPEVMVHVSLRFPLLDPEALGAHLGPLVMAALAAGGKSTMISVQPYDPNEEVSE